MEAYSVMALNAESKKRVQRGLTSY